MGIRKHSTSKGDALMTKKPFADLVRKCSLCKELSSQRTNVVLGNGPVPSPLVILGEAPGTKEDATGLPFQGASGQLLRANLYTKGLSNDDYHCLNVLKCRPPGNRNPLACELNNCRKFLLHQLKVIKPKVILCTGRYAQAFALHTHPGKVRVSKNVGKIVTVRWNSSQHIKAVLTYHPAYVMRRRGDIEPEFRKHIAKAKRLLTKDM